MNSSERKKSKATIPLDLSFRERLSVWFGGFKLRNKAKFVGKNVFCIGKMTLKIKGDLRIGNKSIFRSDFQNTRLAIGKNASLIIGKSCFMNSVIIAANNQIEIGDHCRFGPFVHLMDSDFHDLNDRTKAGKSAPIVIENEVQLGARVIVLRGVTIGNGAVVLPGSVVTKDVLAGTKVAGIPAIEVV